MPSVSKAIVNKQLANINEIMVSNEFFDEFDRV